MYMRVQTMIFRQHWYAKNVFAKNSIRTEFAIPAFLATFKIRCVVLSALCKFDAIEPLDSIVRSPIGT
jgi:hypothetical protein